MANLRCRADDLAIVVTCGRRSDWMLGKIFHLSHVEDFGGVPHWRTFNRVPHELADGYVSLVMDAWLRPLRGDETPVAAGLPQEVTA